MCSQKDMDKIDSGKYVVVSKKEHYIKLYVPLISLVLTMLTFVVIGTRWTSIIETEVAGHIKSKDIHMPMAEKIQVFIPRTDLETTFIAIDNKQDLIIQMIRDIK